ncbi:MAG: radical SAM protein [Anaerolineae bacterium]
MESRQDTNSTDRFDLEQALAAHNSRLAECWHIRSRHHLPTIRFDRPSATIPVSLTGTACALQCAHCNGVYLQHMHTLEQSLVSSARSALISGGCDQAGRVPVTSQLAQIAELRASGRRLNWHVGLIDEDTIRTIAPLVDLVSFDIVGDTATAREVYGLDLKLDDYLRTYDMLRQHVTVVPHITIGLRGGELSGESAALAALAERQVKDVVFLVLIPTPGTAYAHRPPPALSEVASILIQARLELPQSLLYLGCMRPKGDYRLACDELALRAGINVIVNPLRPTVSLAQELGLQVIWGDECCALN